MSVHTLPIRPRAENELKLLPAITVTRDWPVNLAPSDASLFYHELFRQFPPVRLRTVRGAKIVPGLGLCYRSGSIREAQLRWDDSLFAKGHRAVGTACRAIAWWSKSAERFGSDELFWI